MTNVRPSRSAFVTTATLVAVAALARPAAAQTIYTWANSNISGSGSTSLNWFNPTQGTWGGGTPVQDNPATVIQFFSNNTTNLSNAGAFQQTTVIDGTSAFKLTTLNLLGRGNATASLPVTMTISGSALNFAATTGTIAFNSAEGGSGSGVNYTISAPIQLGSTGTSNALTVSAANPANTTYRIDGVISELGAGSSLVKTGGGTLTLSASNSYSGGTVVSGGILVAGTNYAVGTGTVTVNAGARLQANTLDALRSSAGGPAVPITLAASSTFALPAVSGTMGNDIQTGSSAGTVRILYNNSGGNIRLGSLTTNAAQTITSLNTGVSGTITFGNVTLGGNAQFTLVDAAAKQGWRLGGISETGGSRSATFSGANSAGAWNEATWTISGSSSYSGGTTLSAGQLTVTSDYALGSGTITINGGRLTATAQNALRSNVDNTPLPITIAPGPTLDLPSVSGTLGNNIQTTAAAGTVTIGYFVNGGTVRMGNLTLGAGQTIGPASNQMGTIVFGTASLGGNMLMNAAPGGQATNWTFDRIVETGGSRSVTIQGQLNLYNATSVTFTGSNAYSGGTIVSSGQLIANASYALGSGPITVNGGQLRASADYVSAATGTISINNGGTLRSTAVNALRSAVDNTPFAISIAPGGAMVVTSGTGTLANDIVTTASAGTIGITYAGPSTGSAIRLGNLTINAAQTVGHNSEAIGAITFGTATLGGNVTFALPAAANAAGWTFNRVVETGGSRSVTITGATGAYNATSVTFSGSNSYSGGTVVNSGQLNASADYALGSGSITVNGGILQASTINAFRSNVDNTSLPITMAPGGTLKFSSVSGIMANDIQTTAAAGTINLGYVGSGSTMRIGNLTVNANQTINQTNDTWGTLVFGTATLGGNVTFAMPGGSNASNWTIGPVIETGGSRSVTITGITGVYYATSVTFSGASTYTGTTTIGSGALFQVTGRLLGATGTYAGNVSNAGSFQYASAEDSILAGTISGTGSITKSAAGTLVLSGSNTYSGRTTISGGILQAAAPQSLYGGTTASWSKANLFVGNGGTLALSVGGVGEFTAANVTTLLTQLSGSVAAGTGGLNAGSAIGFDTTNAGGLFTLNNVVADTTGGGGGAVGLVKVGSGTLALTATNTYSGATTVRGGVLQLAVARALPGSSALTVGAGGAVDVAVSSTTSAAVTVSGTGTMLFGAGTLTAGSFTFNNASGTATPGVVLAGAGGLTKSNGGTLILSQSSTFTGPTTVGGGVVLVDRLANAGSPSPLGSGTTISFGSGSSTGTLRYTGNGHSSNRPLDLAGTTGGGGIESNGTGPLVFTGTVSTSGVGAKVFTLGGSNTGTNSIGVINGTDVSVTKTGPGTWQITGDGNYSGRLTVLDGTLVVGPVGAGNSPFGSSTGDNFLPRIGTSAVGATGTAAILGQNGMISRGFFVDQSNGSQVVVLGGVGSGTTTFASGMSIYLGRDVTLQAADNGTAEFAMTWRDFSTGSLTPVVGFTIGSTGNAGTVVLGRQLPTTATAVNVVAGTLRPNDNERIVSSTPVSLGGAGGPATLDLFGFTQSLASLSFNGNGSSVTSSQAGGTLLLYNNGTSNAAVNVTGTGHVISAAMALDDPANFNVNAGGRLVVSSTIGTGSDGAKALTKSGLGILEFSGTSDYTGETLVTAGQLRVNGRLGNTAVTVQAGATLGGSGRLAGSLTGDGLIAPGNSPGILTVEGQLMPTGTTSFAFELTGTGSPTWSNASASINDVLRLTNADPFTSSLVSGNVVNVYFDVASLAAGDTFLGGFFSDNPNGTPNLLTSELGTATFTYFVRGTGGGATVYNETSYLPLADYMLSNPGITGVTSSVVNASADFAGGSTINGQVTQFVIVPEPGAIALAGIGIAAAAYSALRRRPL